MTRLFILTKINSRLIALAGNHLADGLPLAHLMA